MSFGSATISLIYSAIAFLGWPFRMYFWARSNIFSLSNAKRVPLLYRIVLHKNLIKEQEKVKPLKFHQSRVCHSRPVLRCGGESETVLERRRKVNPVRNSRRALNHALRGGIPYGAEPGIILKPNLAAAAGPGSAPEGLLPRREGLWPGGNSGGLFLI